MVPEIQSAKDKVFCHVRPFFCPLTLLTTQKIQFKKNEKMPEDIIFYTCVPQMTIMMHSFWYVKHDRQAFLSFWAIFCPFTPLTIQKIKILKKWKKLLEILSFTQVHHKWQSYDIWFLRYQLQQRCFWPSLAMFCSYTP